MIICLKQSLYDMSVSASTERLYDTWWQEREQQVGFDEAGEELKDTLVEKSETLKCCHCMWLVRTAV